MPRPLLLAGFAGLALTLVPAAAHAGPTVMPICFPVDGTVSYTDTFGAPRGDHSHEGQDLMGAKMMPLVSTVDGVVEEIVFVNSKGNRVVVRDDAGWRYVYLHMNNDTPGTDDGNASRNHVFPPGLDVGDRVRAGEFVGYMGDSGNAEGTTAHLHFEIGSPGPGHWSFGAPINPYASLRAAPRCEDPFDATRWRPFDSTVDLVDRQYRDFYSRAPEAGGLGYWSTQLVRRDETPSSFIAQVLAAPEFEVRIAPVTRLYWAYFLRIPDTGGLLYWLDRAGDGMGLAAISEEFANSQEFATTYASAAGDVGEFVDLVYRNVLDREPDAEGRAFWTEQLTSGARTRGEVMVGFSESEEYIDRMRESVRVALAYIAMLERAPDQGGFDFWTAQGAAALVPGILYSDEYEARIDGLD